jgi:hypothetical protein
VSRRLLFVLALLGAVGLIAFWLAPSGEAPPTGVATTVEADQPEVAVARPTMPAPGAGHAGAITGFVRSGGVGVARARVSLKATTPLVVETLDDGAFRIDGVVREPVFLAAAQGALASDVLGPFVVEPGKTTDGVVLELKPTVQLHGVVRSVVTRAPIARAIISWSGEIGRAHV